MRTDSFGYERCVLLRAWGLRHMRWVAAVFVVVCSFGAMTSVTAQDKRSLETCLADSGFMPSGPIRDLMAVQLGEDFDAPAWQTIKDQWARLECGEKVATVAAECDVLAADPKSNIWATSQLLAMEKREPIALIDAVSVAALDDAQRVVSLRAISGVFRRGKYDLPLAALRDSLSWALASDNVELKNAAEILLARQGDKDSQSLRGQRLMECAESNAGNACLAADEVATAGNPMIRQYWDGASAGQQFWVAKWASRDAENSAYLLTRVLDADMATQGNLLTGPLKVIEGDGRITLAKALLKQALDDPSRRPERVSIDFDADTEDEVLGFKAYGESRFPFALQEAFAEIASAYDEEAEALLGGIGDLDHPWLATVAGMLQLQNNTIKPAMTLLRFSIEEDGVPARIVLELAGHSDSMSIQPDLLLAIAERGDADKWILMSRWTLSPEVETKEVLDSIFARAKSLPARFRKTDIDLSLDEKLPLRIREYQSLIDELGGVKNMLDKLLTNHREEVIDVAESFLAQKEPIWHMSAMEYFSKAGDRRAVAIAERFSSHPNEEARKTATQVIDQMNRGYDPRK